MNYNFVGEKKEKRKPSDQWRIGFESLKVEILALI